MRLTLILLAVLSPLTMSVAVVAAQDTAENVAEDVAENAAEAEDKGGNIGGLLFIGGSVAFGLTIYFTIKQVRRASVRRRTRLVEAAASELGLTVQLEGDSTLEDELSPFPLFNIGINREIRNLIVADTPEVSLSIFDYKYERRSDDGINHHIWQTVVAVRSPELQTPTFHLYPEGFFSKIGSALGGQDIDFDDHPDFSKAFILKSEVEKETRDFFDEPLLDFFVQHTDITFEARPGTALYFRSRKRIEPTATALRNFMEEGLQAFRAVRERITE